MFNALQPEESSLESKWIALSGVFESGIETEPSLPAVPSAAPIPSRPPASCAVHEVASSDDEHPHSATNARARGQDRLIREFMSLSPGRVTLMVAPGAPLCRRNGPIRQASGSTPRVAQRMRHVGNIVVEIDLCAGPRCEEGAGECGIRMGKVRILQRQPAIPHD
jgi:hypothetical protein